MRIINTTTTKPTRKTEARSTYEKIQPRIVDLVVAVITYNSARNNILFTKHANPATTGETREYRVSASYY